MRAENGAFVTSVPFPRGRPPVGAALDDPFVGAIPNTGRTFLPPIAFR